MSELEFMNKRPWQLANLPPPLRLQHVWMDALARPSCTTCGDSCLCVQQHTQLVFSISVTAQPNAISQFRAKAGAG